MSILHKWLICISKSKTWLISGMEPKGQPNEQMEEVVLQPTQPKLVSFLQTTSKIGLWANLNFKRNPLKILNFIFRIQRPEMEVARAKIYPAECLRVFYLKYFRTQKNLSNVLIDISHFAAFRISVQLSIFPRDVMIVWRHNCVAAWVWWNTWLDMFIQSQSYLSPLPWLSDDVINDSYRWRHTVGFLSTLLSRIYI